ncbi:pyroglutamyl-peptidase I [Thermosediminibacter litoriperuensis]|uniref:Pyrrolidone-carboxylate peptidase n=1 Tax=Thermosediminibacter litoriperuensis TaxID=291989 RepID=A0A5S5AHX7_9FIRM|nr:pyroglutamyl-peptidase I [Thermosediminibacter litoriperuensis]TYP49795.1 pyroglutamyl-peptidase [Thermosediminibacter litoriperuensis]
MKVLVTGFEPFGGEKVNPALEAVKLLPKEIKGARVVVRELPTVFGKSLDVLFNEMEKEKPDVVICVGQAGGRYAVSVERVAINVDDARIPDNEGNQPVDQPIFPDGENAYFSTLPIKRIVEAIKKEGIPAEVSNTAGTYVCNHVMYGLLYYASRKRPDIKAGFIHVPYLFEQVVDKKNTPAMGLNEIVKALTVAIEQSII